MTLSDEELHALAVHPRINRLNAEIAELSVALKMHDRLEHVPPDLSDSGEIVAGIRERNTEISELRGDDR